LVGNNSVTVESIEQEGKIVDRVSASDWAIITLKGNTIDQIHEVRTNILFEEYYLNVILREL